MSHRHAIVGPLPVLVLALVTMSLSGCTYSATGISIGNNVAYVHGVALRYRRTVSLAGPVDWSQLVIRARAGDIELAAGNDPSADLTVDLFEIEPGDAVVRFTQDGIEAQSLTDQPVVLYHIRGATPNTPLDLDTGSGDINITGYHDLTRVKLRTGSGDIAARSLEGIARLDAGTGSGSVHIAEVTDVADARVRTGSGSISIDDSHIATLSASTGSGNISLTDAGLSTLSADTGSGNIHLTRTTYDRMNAHTGSGKVYE